MKADIIPYTPDEAARLGNILFRLGVPSFGPNTGLELLRVVTGLDEVINDHKKELTPDMLLVVQGIRTRLTDICAITAHQQGAVLEHFEKILKKGQ